MRRRTPPRSEAELLARAHALIGHSLAEIAYALGADDPEGGTHAKGQAGSLVEAALGAPKTSGRSCDFPELGVELKSVPVQDSGVPRESTYVCYFALGEAERETWEGSWLRRKLSRVLWLATSEARTAWPERCVLGAWMWSPDADEEAALRADFEELVGLAARGRIDELTAERGSVLQVRPKAAHSGVRTAVLTDEGDTVLTVPRGFYLRPAFVGRVLARLQSAG